MKRKIRPLKLRIPPPKIAFCNGKLMINKKHQAANGRMSPNDVMAELSWTGDQGQEGASQKHPLDRVSKPAETSFQKIPVTEDYLPLTNPPPISSLLLLFSTFAIHYKGQRSNWNWPFRIRNSNPVDLQVSTRQIPILVLFSHRSSQINGTRQGITTFLTCN